MKNILFIILSLSINFTIPLIIIFFTYLWGETYWFIIYSFATFLKYINYICYLQSFRKIYSEWKIASNCSKAKNITADSVKTFRWILFTPIIKPNYSLNKIMISFNKTVQMEVVWKIIMESSFFFFLIRFFFTFFLPFSW